MHEYLRKCITDGKHLHFGDDGGWLIGGQYAGLNSRETVSLKLDSLYLHARRLSEQKGWEYIWTIFPPAQHIICFFRGPRKQQQQTFRIYLNTAGRVILLDFARACIRKGMFAYNLWRRPAYVKGRQAVVMTCTVYGTAGGSGDSWVLLCWPPVGPRACTRQQQLPIVGTAIISNWSFV